MRKVRMIRKCESVCFLHPLTFFGRGSLAGKRRNTTRCPPPVAHLWVAHYMAHHTAVADDPVTGLVEALTEISTVTETFSKKDHNDCDTALRRHNAFSSTCTPPTAPTCLTSCHRGRQSVLLCVVRRVVDGTECLSLLCLPPNLHGQPWIRHARVGSHTGSRHCQEPASVGLVSAEIPWPGWSRPGTWRGPDDA
jgi:hypothetical protein